MPLFGPYISKHGKATDHGPTKTNKVKCWPTSIPAKANPKVHRICESLYILLRGLLLLLHYCIALLKKPILSSGPSNVKKLSKKYLVTTPILVFPDYKQAIYFGCLCQ